MFLFWHESRKTKSCIQIQFVWIYLTKARAGDLSNERVTWLFSTLWATRFSNSVSFSIPLCFESREGGGGLQLKSAQVTALRWKTLLKGGTCPGVGVEMDDELNTATFWLWPRPGSCDEAIFANFALEQAGHLAEVPFVPTQRQLHFPVQPTLAHTMLPSRNLDFAPYLWGPRNWEDGLIIRRAVSFTKD